jgi:DNA-binding NarL/FixJ family response regulator
MSVRVLIADDQAPFRRAAGSVLGSSPDFELVGEAISGEEAVMLVDSLAPDVVLMDIKMPGIGGIEAARAIAALRPHTLTILLSTYREQDLPADARTCGAAAYLHKSDFAAHALRELWDASRAHRGRGSLPSPAYEPRSPRRGRA